MRSTTMTAIAAVFLISCNNHEHNEGNSSENEAQLHAGEIHFTAEQAKDARLKIDTIQPSEFHYVLHTSGQILALQGEEQTIAASTNGILNFINASITEGTAVNKGENIASVSARNLQEGDPVQKAKLAFETAERDFQRAERLITDRIISVKEYERIRLQYETAKAAYEGQAANFTAKGISISAPISGYIKTLNVAHGEYVSVGQTIAVVAQNRKLQLRADITERNFHFIRDIQSANFRTSYDEHVYRLEDLNGKLLSYGKSATGKSSYIPVTFEFDNIGNIIPGSFTDVFLLSSTKENVLSIPISALTEEQGLMFVYLQIDDDIYKKQEVTLGNSDGTRVEILSGINAGDRVVTHGAYQVKLASMSTAIPEHSHSH